MTDEAKAARNAYRRSWYAANKDKAKASQDRHWQKVADNQRGQAEEGFYYPECFREAFERLAAEKRSALGVTKLTPEQQQEIALQIFKGGVLRPEYKDK